MVSFSDMISLLEDDWRDEGLRIPATRVELPILGDSELESATPDLL